MLFMCIYAEFHTFIINHDVILDDKTSLTITVLHNKYFN